METRSGPSSTSELQEQLEQHQVLIEQLKGMVRENEESSRQKEHELKESAAKLSKLKLQHKARVAQLTSQLNELQRSKSTTAALEGDDEASVDSASPDHGSRGKIIMLKKRMEENRVLFERREKELADNKRSIESRLEEMQAKLIERDKQIEEMQTSGKSSEKIESSSTESAGEAQIQEMYAQMVYKDSRIIELNNHILKLETNIMDLQENLKEKDEVIQSRNIAIQLMTEDLSRKGKNVVDQLDDTRDQMKVMQEHFITVEAAWKEEQTRLNADLEALKEKHANYVSESNRKITELKSSMAKLESVRFDLSAKNAQLQEKIVHLQELLEKEKHKPAEDVAANVKCLTEEKEKLQEEIKAKEFLLQELQTFSNRAVKSADQKLIKLKAQHQNRIKALESQIQDLKENNDLSEHVILLKNQLVELEEEKGNLQLKLVEFDDIQQSNEKLRCVIEELQEKLKLQNADVDNYLKNITFLENEKINITEQLDESKNAMEEYRAAIEENNLQMRTLEDAKVSLEMRLVEIEELRDSIEGQKQDLLAEVAILKRKLVGDDTSVFAIEQERNCLQSKLTETENMLKDSAEKCSSTEAELEELRGVHANLIEKCESLSIDKERLSAYLINQEEMVNILQKQYDSVAEELKKTLEDQEHRVNNLAQKYGADEATFDALVLTWDRIIEKLNECKKEVEEKEGNINTLHIELQQVKVLHENEEEMHKSEMEQLNSLIEKQLEEVRMLKDDMDTKNKEIMSNCESLEVQIKENKFLEELLQHKEESFMEKSKLVVDLQQELQILSEDRILEISKAESKVASLFNQLNDLETEVSSLQQEVGEKQLEMESLREERDAALSDAAVLRDNLAKEERNLQDALDKINDLESTYLTENKMLKEEYNQMQQLLQIAKDEVNRHENNVACKERELEQISQQMHTYVGYEDEIRSLHAQLEDALNRNTEFGNQFHVLQLEYDNKINELNAVRLQMSEMEENLSQIQSELTLTRNSYADKEATFVALEEKYRDLEKDLSEALSIKQELQKSVSNSNEEFDSIVSSHDSIVKDLTEKCNQLEKDNAVLDEKLRQNDKISDENRYLLDKIQNLEEGNNNLSERLAAAQGSEDSYMEEIDSLQNKVKELQNNLDESEHSVEYMKEEITKSLNKADQLEINLNTSKEALSKCEYELEGLQSTVLDMTNEIENKTAQLMHNELALKSVVSSKDELEEYITRVQNENTALNMKLHEISFKVQEENSEYSSLIEKMKALSAENDNLELQLKQMGDKGKILMELRAEKEVLVGDVDQARDRIDLLLDQVSQLEGDKSIAQVSNEKLVMYIEQLEADLKSTAESLQNVEEELKRLVHSDEVKANKIKGLLLQIHDLDQERYTLQKENEDLKLDAKDSLKEWHEKLALKEQQLHNLNVQLEKLQGEHDILLSRQGESCENCAQCIAENNELRNRIELLQEDLTKADEVKASIECALAEVNHERQLLDKRMKEMMQEMEEVVTKAERTNEDLQKLNADLHDIKEKLMAAEQQLQSSQNEVDVRNKEIVDITDKFEAAKTEIQKLEYILVEVKDSLDVEKKNLQSALDTINALNAEKEEIQITNQGLLENIQVLKAQQEGLMREAETRKSEVTNTVQEEDVRKDTEVLQKSSIVEDEEKAQLKKQLQELRVKSGRMLAKLKAFKEKNDKLEREIVSLQSERNLLEEKVNSLVLNEESVKSSSDDLLLQLEKSSEEIAGLKESVKRLRDKEDSLEVGNATLVDIKENLERNMNAITAELAAEKNNFESNVAVLVKKNEELTSELELSNNETSKLQKRLNEVLGEVADLTTANEDVSQSNVTLKDRIVELSASFKIEKEWFESRLKEMAECEETLTKQCEDLSSQLQISKGELENLAANQIALQLANEDLLNMKEALERQLGEKTAEFVAEKESLKSRIKELEESEGCNTYLSSQLECSNTEITRLMEKVVALEDDCTSLKSMKETLEQQMSDKLADEAEKEVLEGRVKELEENELILSKKCQDFCSQLETLNEDNLTLRLNAVLVKEDKTMDSANEDLIRVKETLERELDEKTAEFNAEKESLEFRIRELVEREGYSLEECSKLSSELENSKHELENLLEEVAALKAANDDLANMKIDLQQQLDQKIAELQDKESSFEIRIKAMEEREESHSNKCRELSTELEMSKEETDKIRKELGNVLEKENSLQNESETLQQVIEELKHQIEEYRDSVENLRARLSQTEAEKRSEVDELESNFTWERAKYQQELMEIMDQNRFFENDNVQFQTLNDQLRDAKVRLDQELINSKLLLEEEHKLLATANEEKMKLELEIQSLKERFISACAEKDTWIEHFNREKENVERLHEQLEGKEDVVTYKTELETLSSQLLEESQVISLLERDIVKCKEKLDLSERSKEILERREGELTEEVNYLKSVLLEREVQMNELLQNVTAGERLRVKLQEVEASLERFVKNLGIEEIESRALREPLEALPHLETYIRQLQLENSNLEAQLHLLPQLENRVRQLQENKRDLEVQVNKTHLLKSSGEQTDKVYFLQAELQRTMESLHARDIRCENLTMDISNLIEERDSLQLRLATTLTREHHLELELRKLQHNYHNDSISTRSNDASVQQFQLSGASDLPALQKQLEANDKFRFELQQTNAALEEALALEREDRLNIQTRLKFAEEELAALGRKSQKDSVHINFEEEHPLLVPENERTLTRSYTSATWRIANWIQGRSTPRVLHV